MPPASKPAFKDANRAQLSILAPLEKRTLLWLAARMPAAVNSDHLTVLGFLSLIGAGLSYWYARTDRIGLIFVIGFLILNWFGDSLDGTLARYRQRLRPRYGFYVDHVVDMFGTFLLLSGLGLSGYMSFPLAMALVIGYFMLSIEVYLTTYTIGTFHLSFWKFSPTELRILLAIGNIALLVRGGGVKIAGQQMLLFDVGGAVGLVGMALMLVISTIKHTIQLYNEERLP